MNSNLIDRTYDYVLEVEVSLKNSSPLRIGTGEDETVLLTDNDKSIIFGSSLCGAVKDFLIKIYGKERVEEFLGGTKIETDKNGNKRESHKESKMFFSDMISEDEVTKKIIGRDGIRIDGSVGTTADKGKYKTIYIGKDSKYKFTVKAFLSDENREELKALIKSSIKGINEKQILFGADKTKGFGEFEVLDSNFIEFDLKTDMENYLRRNILNETQMKAFDYSGGEALKTFEAITFTGKIKDSFLLKGEGKEEKYKDITGKDKTKKVQYSLEEGEKNYIIPSGSIKGSMRAYTEKIMNTLHGEKEHEVIRELFGHKSDEKNHDKYQMGKLIIQDCEIKETKETEYHRIKIDRFTGGAISGALINEKRLVDGVINLKIQVRGSLEPQEKALILLYLRDLGLGKITLGSNASVGSGRVEGIKIDFVDDVFLQFKDGNIDKDKSKNIDNISAYLEELNRGVNA